MNIRKWLVTFSLSAFLFLFVGAVSAAAATLNFNPNSVDTQQDGTFSVDVMVDAGTEQVTGTDVYVLYDPQYLQLQTVTAGSLFPKSDNMPSSGKLYVWGVIENQGDYKTGQGVLSTLTFKVIKGGNTAVTFECNTSATETSKVLKNDINATNVINCAGNGSLQVNSPTTGSSTTSTTTTPATLPQSGVYENVLMYSASGLLLLFIGAALRFVSR